MMISLLTIYSLRDIQIVSFPYGLPTFLSILAVVLLHLKFKNSMLSIFLGTALYMILSHFFNNAAHFFLHFPLQKIFKNLPSVHCDYYIRFYSESKEAIDVTNPATNATNLKDSNGTWYYETITRNWD